jgi:hypothetical protein
MCTTEQLVVQHRIHVTEDLIRPDGPSQPCLTDNPGAAGLSWRLLGSAGIQIAHTGYLVELFLALVVFDGEHPKVFFVDFEVAA